MAEEELGVAGGRLVILVEAQPELRAIAATAELIEALREVEGDLMRARTVYNRTVQTYEDRRRAVPGLVGLALLGFRPQAYWLRRRGRPSYQPPATIRPTLG